jgi:hypothetical protein
MSVVVHFAALMRPTAERQRGHSYPDRLPRNRSGQGELGKGENGGGTGFFGQFGASIAIRAASVWLQALGWRLLLERYALIALENLGMDNAGQPLIPLSGIATPGGGPRRWLAP